MDADAALIRAVRTELRRAGNPADAERMRAYMRSVMPYRGVRAAAQERIFKTVFAAHPLSTFEAWRDTALVLWRDARFREERYAAIALTGHRPYRDYQTLGALPLYEEMIVTGAWWDYVDAVAIHRVGGLLRLYPARMRLTVRGWSRCEDVWKRRSSIICQVSFKADTDLGLLYECIDRNIKDPEFFVRKAIGWALRAYAWTDPAEVVRYVREHEAELSPLSRREALKNTAKLIGGKP